MAEGYGLSEKRIQHYWENANTQEFLEALEMELSLNSRNVGELKIIETRKGKYGGTWVCPEIFVDIAMWLNPTFKAKVMIWLSFAHRLSDTLDDLFVFDNILIA